jgi:hypothetical protein
LGEPVEMSGLIQRLIFIFEEKQQINLSVNGCDCKNLRVKEKQKGTANFDLKIII